MNIVNPKNLLFIIFLISLRIITSSDKITGTELYGSWIGNLDDKELKIDFDQHNNIKINYFDADSNHTIYGKYEINFLKKPMPLKLYNIDELDNSVYSSVMFLSSEELFLSKFSSSWKTRPLMLDNQNSIFLKKK